MKKKVNIEFHELSTFLTFKKELWQISNSLFDFEEEAYYERLHLFNHFAIFKVEDKIVGFLSIFIDNTVVHSKPAVLLGIGLSALLPEYRNQNLLPKALFKFLPKFLLINPLKPHYFWAMAITHLSYRMGIRASKFQYPTPDGNCPTPYKELLDWLGNKYYKETYCSADSTAEVNFSATGESIFPSDKEMEDPIVAHFIKKIPSALAPNNKAGILSIAPVGPNLPFWMKKFTWGRLSKKKKKLNKSLAF